MSRLGYIALAIVGTGIVGTISFYTFLNRMPVVPAVDISQAACITIADFRGKVAEEYKAKIETIANAFAETSRAFKNAIIECLSLAFRENPCEREARELQNAYEKAMGPIRTDEAYNNYWTKSSAYKACHDNFKANEQKFFDEAREREEACRASLQQQLAVAVSERQAEQQKAEAKNTADLAALDELERRCRVTEKKRITDLIKTADDFVKVHNQEVLGEPPEYKPQTAACTGVTEETRTRTRQADENVAKDIAIEIATELADELGKTPIPTNAISDKIFAGIVTMKLQARLIQLQGEEADALSGNDRSAQIRLRRKIAKYKKAQEIWAGIAEGRKEIKEEIRVFLGDSLSCQTSADCGEAVCCSASQIGKWVCNGGKCETLQKACPQNSTCKGKPAECVPNAVQIQALFYQGKLIPLTQVHSGTGKECDGGVGHWHANGSAAKALDGSTVSDPDPNGCGFGKVGEVPVVEVYSQP